MQRGKEKSRSAAGGGHSRHFNRDMVLEKIGLLRTNPEAAMARKGSKPLKLGKKEGVLEERQNHEMQKRTEETHRPEFENHPRFRQRRQKQKKRHKKSADRPKTWRKGGRTTYE